MRFVDDDEVPRGGDKVFGFVSGKVIGADDEIWLVGLEGVGAACFDGLLVGAGLKDGGRQEELFRHFLMPLLPQIGRGDDEDASLPFRPALREKNSGFDRLAKADFIGEKGTIGEGGFEGKKGGVDLMGIEIDLGTCHGGREAAHAVGRPTASELVGKVFGLVVSETPCCCVWHNLLLFWISGQLDGGKENGWGIIGMILGIVHSG